MKRLKLSVFGILSLFFTLNTAQAIVIYDNGPFINSSGTGIGGAEESILQTQSLGMNLLGFAHSDSDIGGFRVADDFTVTDAEGWQIDAISFFAYQTSSTTLSTFTEANFQIWDGIPGSVGSSVIFGDTSTNRLLSSSWTGAYRVTETTTGMNDSRPIMELVVDAGINLGLGTYWLDWQTEGTLPNGPWALPITINGSTTTGNARQLSPNLGSWNSIEDVGSQGLPFLLHENSATQVPEPPTIALFGLALLGAFAGYTRKSKSKV